jgi:drug/metabolite transporter (DMT)-like permease
MLSPLLLPLASALLYVVGALLVRRAAQLGAGLWRTAFIANIPVGLLFLPLWFLGPAPEAAANLSPWQPIAVALLFIGGQFFTFLALDRGDVSVATPVLGLKVIFVACFSVLVLREIPDARLWLAAALSAAAILLLQGPRPTALQPSTIGFTIISATIAAACYALFDVCVQRWSPLWGIGRLLPYMALAFLAMNCLFLLRARQPLRLLPRPAWPWLCAGGLFFGLQSIVLVTALGTFGRATEMNVVYSSRGLWSVLAVWSVGHWFQNTEHAQGAKILIPRLIGAALMLAAVALALVR